MSNDLPSSVVCAGSLQRLLEHYGNPTGSSLLLFAEDEMAFSREPVLPAGFYQKVYIGERLWFLNISELVQCFRAAVTQIGGIYRSSDFANGPGTFLSVLARHDTSRRLGAALLTPFWHIWFAKAYWSGAWRSKLPSIGWMLNRAGCANIE